MNIITYNKEKHYNILESWYKDWNLPITPSSWIPDTSYMVYNDLKPICSGFLYQLGQTPMYFVEGIISNRSASKDERKEALDKLIKHAYVVSKELKGEILMTTTPRFSLTQLFVENGFNYTPEAYFHLGRGI